MGATQTRHTTTRTNGPQAITNGSRDGARMQKTWRIYGPAGEVNYTGGESVRDVNVYTIYWRSGSREESGISRGQAVWALHTIHG